jgi:pyruvate dehydrogenase E1 component alpha subunit
MAATKTSSTGARSKSTKSATRSRGAAKSAAPAIAMFDKDHAYREMLQIRRFEEKAGQLYGMGLIGGFCHLYIGQEAVVVGMQRPRRMATR